MDFSFDAEVKGSMFLRNVGEFLQDYTELYNLKDSIFHNDGSEKMQQMSCL
jgi:hypothetical protein